MLGMKKLIPLLLLLMFVNIEAQESHETKVRQTIETFFKGFHAKDTLLIKKTVSDEIIVQSIGANKDGKASVRTEDFSKFLNSIASIPDSVDFQEKIQSFNIQIDGTMANAWTPYEFWYKGTFSHCGVNSFQLFKNGSDWQIIYLIDTRRREGCNE
jgi:hypothetical protein